MVWNPDTKTVERLAFQVARTGFLAPSLAYLDDQRLLVSDDARVTILDLATGGSPIGRFALSNPVGITFKFSLAVSSDATRVVTADDREATIWNTAPESRDAATIRALVERLPWKLERGRVVARP